MSTFGFVVANNYDAKKDNNKETAKSEQINNDSNRNIDIIRVNSQGITLPFTIINSWATTSLLNATREDITNIIDIR